MCDPNRFLKVCTVHLKVSRVKHYRGKHGPLLERGIKFLHDELLLLPVKPAVLRVTRERIVKGFAA
jgi:hypothetical protein